MDKIQALQVIRGVINKLSLLKQNGELKYSGEDVVEEAYAIIHEAVENDMKDFHLSDHLMEQVKTGNLICYNYLHEINGFEIKLSIFPIKQDEEKEDTKWLAKNSKNLKKT